MKSRYIATKVGAIVGGQTSVKAPERAAFEKYLPPDVDIVSCHSLHGPTVSPEGEPLVGLYTGATTSGTLILQLGHYQPSRLQYIAGSRRRCFTTAQVSLCIPKL